MDDTIMAAPLDDTPRRCCWSMEEGLAVLAVGGGAAAAAAVLGVDLVDVVVEGAWFRGEKA